MTSGLFRLSDINECTISVDNCDANAFCNNTDGSFDCICSPGYTGSGTSCTGKSFSGHIKLYYELRNRSTPIYTYNGASLYTLSPYLTLVIIACLQKIRAAFSPSRCK